jgi:hypothetical protein
MCSATDYPVAERLMYPLTDRRKIVSLREATKSRLSAVSSFLFCIEDRHGWAALTGVFQSPI